MKTEFHAGPTGRPGPRPLGLHLLTVAGSLTSSCVAFQAWRSGSGFWSQTTAKAAALRAELSELTAADLQRLQVEIDSEARKRLDAFYRGVSAYKCHPYKRDLPDPEVVWQRGSARLLDYGGQGRPVLFVPSLVNRAYILDLSRESSLLRWLCAEGVRPLLIDWGSPGAVEQEFDLTGYIRQRLAPALDWACARAGAPIPVTGYCMGGLLAVALATVAPAQVSGLALLATPWDFQAENLQQALVLASAVRFWGPLCQANVLPVDAIQALFWTLDPFMVQRKFIRFAAMDQSSRQARAFVALEDWLNDGVPLAGPVARECLADWYGRNTPAALRWQIDGVAVDPGGVHCPSMVVVSEIDRIVPPQSAMALAKALPNTRILSRRLGHVGMVVAREAKVTVWRPLADWLASA